MLVSVELPVYVVVFSAMMCIVSFLVAASNVASMFVMSTKQAAVKRA